MKFLKGFTIAMAITLSVVAAAMLLLVLAVRISPAADNNAIKTEAAANAAEQSGGKANNETADTGANEAKGDTPSEDSQGAAKTTASPPEEDSETRAGSNEEGANASVAESYEPAAVDSAGLIGEPTTFNYSVNSADGVKLTWIAQNLTGKTINYYTVKISTFNPVGDPSYDQLTGESSFSVKYVGPVEPDDELLVFDLFTYQGALETIRIDEIVLQYNDGSEVTVNYGYQTSDDSGL
ncbi:hypothetical protein V3851_15175 [Paenibacillus sp. M1]|uniref:Uncharacterized protein n=1 Tax=Paenibacillus haidiansis TaxID=1574488 RepID=A0ABU7VTU9_9BACL